MEDMIEVLMYVSRFRPQVLEGTPMEELLLFFVTFMGSPAYIKNPYLRSRMVEVRPPAHGLTAACLIHCITQAGLEMDCQKSPPTHAVHISPPLLSIWIE